MHVCIVLSILFVMYVCIVLSYKPFGFWLINEVKWRESTCIDLMYTRLSNSTVCSANWETQHILLVFIYVGTFYVFEFKKNFPGDLATYPVILRHGCKSGKKRTNSGVLVPLWSFTLITSSLIISSWIQSSVISSWIQSSVISSWKDIYIYLEHAGYPEKTTTERHTTTELR
jgi:hypothetical protein